MITVQNVTKLFGPTAAIDDISLEIARGEIVGFLGPNGAGKTTLMRMLTSYLPPTKGKVVVAGYDLSKNSMEARRRLGYLPETPPLYPDMTVKTYLKFSAKLKDVEHRLLHKTIDRVLEECSLRDVQNHTIATLSKGYQQRVGIAQAIIHDPEILILDEPTNGLDPQQILQVRNLIKNLEQKKTVLLSTHILPEIEQIAKRVIILNKGKIAADQPLDVLLQKSMGKTVTLEEAFLKLTTS